jgi:membrane fusion protein, heavy metal efflux system
MKILSFFCVRALLLQNLLFGHAHHHDHSEEEDGFHWSKEKSEFAQIEIASAGPGLLQNYVRTTGKVTLHPDCMAYINPKMEGVVYQIYKNLGESVQKGEVIALIESREIAEAKANFLAAFKKWELQQKLLDRESKLRGISAGQDYWNAQLAAEEATIQKDLAMQKLYALGLSEVHMPEILKEKPEQMRLFAIRSPINGKIVQRDLTLGEVVSPDNRAFTVASFEKLWVEINIHQNDVQFLKEGCSIEIAAFDKKEKITLRYLNPTISEETRMATAIALLDNQAQKWKPGEFISAYLQTSTSEASIVIPREAIQKIKGTDFVFIGCEDCFEPIAVKIGKMDENYAEILAGLQPGQTYACSNTFCLKAEFEKGEAGHSH